MLFVLHISLCHQHLGYFSEKEWQGNNNDTESLFTWGAYVASGERLTSTRLLQWCYGLGQALYFSPLTSLLSSTAVLFCLCQAKCH